MDLRRHLIAAAIAGAISIAACSPAPPQSQAAKPEPPAAPTKTHEEILAERVAFMDDELANPRARIDAAVEVKRLATDEPTRTRAGEVEAAMLEKIRLVNVGRQWTYERDSDAMTSAETVSAMVKSSNTHELDFPYNRPQHAALMLRRHPTHGTDVIFVIERGQILCSTYGDCSVRVRFDDQAPRTLRGNPPSDHSSTHVFISGYKDFVSRLSKAKRVMIEVRLYQEGSRVWEFDVEGFRPEEMT